MSSVAVSEDQRQTRSNDPAALPDSSIYPVIEHVITKDQIINDPDSLLCKLTQDQINDTDAAIRKIVGPDIVVEQKLDRDGNLMHWYCRLSHEQRERVEELHAVGEVTKNGPDPDFVLL